MLADALGAGCGLDGARGGCWCATQLVRRRSWSGLRASFAGALRDCGSRSWS